MSEIHVVSSIIGVFGVDGKGAVKDKILFERDVESAARSLSVLQRGEVIEQVEGLVLGLKAKGFEVFVFDDSRLGKAVGSSLGVKVEVRKAESPVSEFRARLAEIAVESDFVRTLADFHRWAREVTTLLARSQVRKASSRRDLQIVQGVLALDDLDRTLNLYTGRIREWYGLHFPELGNLVDKHETYLRLVLGFGRRTNFEATSLEEIGLTEGKSMAITEAASNSLGADVAEEDLAQIKSICEVTLGMYETRRSLGSHIGEVMRECAPNITGLVGSSIGARLLALSGGLERIARMPASTIQVLGAETALFRSLRTGTPPPKHGIIFQSPLIHQAKRWQRGKIARALAGKLAIASRIDAFSDRDLGNNLRRDVEKRVEEIRQRYRLSPEKRRRKRRGGKG